MRDESDHARPDAPRRARPSPFRLCFILHPSPFILLFPCSPPPRPRVTPPPRPNPPPPRPPPPPPLGRSPPPPLSHRPRPPKPVTPAALVLVAAELIVDPVAGDVSVRLAFDRPIDVTNLVPAQITVDDAAGAGWSYAGSGVASRPDARTVV